MSSAIYCVGLIMTEIPVGLKNEIRAIFLKHGFTIKEGETDLKDYVYSAALELHKSAYMKGSNDAWKIAEKGEQ